MGTWGSGIKENDTSFDVYESFFELYHTGMEVSAIKKEILEKFKESYEIEEDRHNVIFPLALCLWEVCYLDKTLLDEVESLILDKKDIELWKNLGANKELLKKRSATLEKFLAKIKSPKEKPKVRKKPPISIETEYKPGVCMTFTYSNGLYGGAIIINSETYKNKGNFQFILTDIQSEVPPTFQDFLKSKLIAFKWDTVYGQSLRYAAYLENEALGYTGRIDCRYLGYTDAKTLKSFIESFNQIFTIVGKLPVFTQILLNTTFPESPEVLVSTFGYYLENYGSTSEESIESLSPLLAGKDL